VREAAADQRACSCFDMSLARILHASDPGRVAGEDVLHFLDCG
jgi:hypothetical protein